MKNSIFTQLGNQRKKYFTKLIILFSLIIFTLQLAYAQNVGIGTTTPQGELHISRPYNWQGVTFSGTGVDDITVNHDNYTGTTERTYIIKVSNAGPDPNKFDWSDDNGSTWTTDVDMSESPITLSYGIQVYWDNDAGHTYDDQWTFTIGADYPNGLIVKNAQVGIGTDSPASCAKLDISDNDKGVLIPRTDTATINSANSGSLQTGLLIYQNSDNTFYYFNGNKWIKLVTQDAVFERNGTTIRQKGNYDTDDFIFGRDSIPQNGELVSDTLFFFDQSKGAFRGGISTNQTDWSPDSLGKGSFAYGNSINAKGQYAIAMGNSSFASGDYSVAMGRGVLAPSGYETSIGRFNTVYTPLSKTGWNDSDRLFSIGKGDLFSRENALTILKNGNMGIGTENPLSKLSVGGDGSTERTIAAHNTDMFGTAIYGIASNSNYGSNNYGGYFEASGSEGTAVYGLASSTGDYPAIGGSFTSFSNAGTGVSGNATGTGGIGVSGSADHSGDVTNYGGYFSAGGDNGRGVYGQVFGQSGKGIYGYASHSSGVNYGVYGSTNSPNGYAGYFAGDVKSTGRLCIGDGAKTPEAGAIRWNSTSGDFEGYTGTEWLSLTGHPQWGESTNSNHENYKIIASDGYDDDQFGHSVSISGDYAIIGTHLDNISGNTNQGSAYIFHQDGAIWTQQDKLIATDGAEGDYFGYSVSIDGDYAIIGAYKDDISGYADQGSAYIFHRDGTNWTQQAKLTASDGTGDDNFGRSVSISGDYAIIGAPYDNISGNADQGSVYIFHRSGTIWSQQTKLTASDGIGADIFGSSVSITGDYAIIGAVWDDYNYTDQGSAYIFHRDGTNWTQQDKLIATDGAEGDYFGYSVSISGDYAIIGARNDVVFGSDYQGSAYIFHRDGTTWTQQAKLTASDGNANDHFGSSVSIAGDYTIIGAGLDNISGNTDQGSAYIFHRSGTTWTEQIKIIASDGYADDQFGYSVSIDGDYAIIGAPYDDISGNADQGSAYFVNK